MTRLKQWLPAEGLRIAKHTLGYGAHMRGNYATWEQASADARGYDAQDILNRVHSATLAVKTGDALFERDGIQFNEPQDAYPLLATLLRAAALSGGHLRLLDFGGALGSSYFQCRPWLSGLASIAWRVVEQPHFVDIGNAEFANEQLSFSSSLQAASEENALNVILFSGVLQYLPTPMTYLNQAIQRRPEFIIIDRTPTIAGTTDVICIQKESRFSRGARSSYPARLFAENNLMSVANQGYRLLSRFKALDAPMGGIGNRIEFKGYIFEREDL